jgi:hypothetical protein
MDTRRGLEDKDKDGGNALRVPRRSGTVEEKPALHCVQDRFCHARHDSATSFTLFLQACERNSIVESIA